MKVENGYIVWNKGDNFQISPSFQSREFECQCTYSECVEQKISQQLMMKLVAVRAEYGAPITIDSGFRCAHHQADLMADPERETVPVSTHEKGDAVDMKARLMSKLVPIVKQHFKAVGIAPTWLHADMRADKVRSWTYKR